MDFFSIWKLLLVNLKYLYDFVEINKNKKLSLLDTFLQNYEDFLVSRSILFYVINKGSYNSDNFDFLDQLFLK